MRIKILNEKEKQFILSFKIYYCCFCNKELGLREKDSRGATCCKKCYKKVIRKNKLKKNRGNSD